MIRWVAVIFITLIIFPALLPFLHKLGIGRAPGDFRFKLFGCIFTLPFGSTLVVCVIAFLIAQLQK
jgi:hypothetical protein